MCKYFHLQGFLFACSINITNLCLKVMNKQTHVLPFGLNQSMFILQPSYPTAAHILQRVLTAWEFRGNFRRQIRKDKEWLFHAITNYGRVCRKGVESGAWRVWGCGKWGLESESVWKVGLGECEGVESGVWRVWNVGLGVCEGVESGA